MTFGFFIGSVAWMFCEAAKGRMDTRGIILFIKVNKGLGKNSDYYGNQPIFGKNIAWKAIIHYICVIGILMNKH